MNNKGQTLILFILLIPIIAIIFVYSLRTIKMVSDKKDTVGLISDNMQIILDNDIRDIDKIKNVLGNGCTVNIENDKILIRIDSVIYCGDYISKTYQKGGC